MTARTQTVGATARRAPEPQLRRAHERVAELDRTARRTLTGRVIGRSEERFAHLKRCYD